MNDQNQRRPISSSLPETSIYGDQVPEPAVTQGESTPAEVIEEVIDNVPVVAEKPITPDTFFEEEESTTEIDIEKVIKEQQAALNETEGNETYKNMKLAIPLSEPEKMREHFKQVIRDNPDKLEELYRDADSAISILTNATETFSDGFSLLKKALEGLSDLGTKFNDERFGITDTSATKFGRFADMDEVNLSHEQSLVVMTALTGGMRRINLLNSGFTITVRNIPMDILNRFYSEMNTSDYEYGKQFGTFYYLFADIAITSYVIENLLPLVICGSTYVHWNDKEKLRKAIKFQDFHTILWAMGLMMYPKGTDIHFVCSEPDCQEITTEKSDLAKLRRNNTDLMNEKMITHFKNTKITDDMLEIYHQDLGLDKTISFEYGDPDNPQKWELSVHQASLYDQLETGNDFIGELQKYCSLKSIEQIHRYNVFNYYRSFRSWITKFKLTSIIEGKEKSFIVKNEPEYNETIDMLFDEFQANVPDFADKMQEYILSTKITHICFYMPTCPKCGAEPASSVGGYIPYDPLYHFFTLALTKLLRGA